MTWYSCTLSFPSDFPSEAFFTITSYSEYSRQQIFLYICWWVFFFVCLFLFAFVLFFSVLFKIFHLHMFH